MPSTSTGYFTRSRYTVIFSLFLSAGHFVEGCQYSGQMSPSQRASIHSARMKRDVITCDPTYRYRSFDGSCNNLKFPTYGQAGAVFRRILDPVYDGDGKGNEPRKTSSSGNSLPAPRDISVLIHDQLNLSVAAVSQMVMQWSQFLDHDITFTPTDSPADNTTECCYDELVTTDEVHSDVATGGACFPIIIGENDRYFNTIPTRCMVFHRSDPVQDVSGVRQQYNANTPWIDGSQIYGSSDDLANTLRSYSGGKLAVKNVGTEDFLPEQEGADDSVCFVREEGEYCFLAGDHRVNVHAGLSALHTVFMRYHNKICDRLSDLHSDWDDETLYQEARRVVVAVLQVITYKDFMRQMLGRENAEAYDLLVGDGDYSYDEDVDPTLSNVFSAAAYRFGHSMVSNSLTINGTVYQTHELFMRPKHIINDLKGLMDGIVAEPLMRTDRWYTTQITDQMFEIPDVEQSGFDIAARNIQRGRDHGLPPYNSWREHFGLGKKSSFDDMDQGGARYSRLFESVEDIDLYSGGISEGTVSGGQVGELYATILGNQFHDLKFGDRFWFENEGDVSSFTSDQIKQLKRASLSRVLCDTVTGIETVLKNPFKTHNAESNPFVNCDEVNDINIERRW